MSRTIVVTDADDRAALAVVRSLGHAGWRLVTCGTTPATLAGRSRHAARSVMVADALADPAGFVADVAAVVAAEGATFVLPIAEPALLALTAHRDQFPPGAIPWPSADVVRAICDKQQVLAAAPSFRIGVPGQVVIASPGDPRDLDGLSFPVVVKPARSVSGAPGQAVKLGVSHASSRAELEQAISTLPAAAFPVLLQERVVGPGIGIFLLIWDGQVRAAFAHRRLREKPPSGGVSVYRESIALDADLLERSRQLLESFGWQGVAMVEYKVNSRTGEPVLMEINGRFWGSLQLAVDAGVDFPRLLIACAEHACPEAAPAYRVGTRLRWWWGDVDQLLLRLTRSEGRLGLLPGSPGRLRAIAEFLAIRPGDRNEVLRLDDPRPFLHESLRWFRAG